MFLPVVSKKRFVSSVPKVNDQALPHHVVLEFVKANDLRTIHILESRIGKLKFSGT